MKIKDRFRLKVVNSLGTEARATTDSQIRSFEKQLQIKLPTNYFDFVKKLGGGELNRYVRIHAPGNHAVDLANLYESVEELPSTTASYFQPFGLIESTDETNTMLLERLQSANLHRKHGRKKKT